MKTCSFRGVQPDESNRYLFCLADPKACHAMTACGNCCICYPKYDVKKRAEGGGRGQPSVQFGLAQRHQFVSKYEAILNCPSVSILLAILAVIC